MGDKEKDTTEDELLGEGATVRHTIETLRAHLDEIEKYSRPTPLDIGDRDFMRGHMRKVRILVTQLGQDVEQVGK